MPNIPILGPDDAVLEDEGEGAILLKGAQGSTWDITDTNLADGHAPKRQLRKELESLGEDMGGGFVQHDIPVIVHRGPDGSIVRTTPLSEIPGVSFTPAGIRLDGPAEEQKEVPTPAAIPRKERDKLVAILTTRLWKYYRQMPPEQQKYNPFYDGIPELPSGSPQHLQPIPGTPLYPATDAQVYDWLRRFVEARVKVVNRNRFGKDNLQDLAVHIE
ncbi:MAG: hypothetical protein GWN18_05810 [Thermoplasmata archaeon]|nr:hypothetical protein [Thermoplasmata archaeon]NIT76614.1 hypothetical protein [Thermoplasmata archaeon]NIW82088.1 hypothetical protein [Thermoplasmata archaeon]NIY02985.1 hypothetical protein [Thermoplasmata archaeon]